MRHRLARGGRRQHHGLQAEHDLVVRRFAVPPGAAPLDRRLTMNWTKPQATDLRYGFEITMYISAR
jgi:coenzyme PQQ precursor peptide PqqA